MQLIRADYVLEVRAHTYQNSRSRDSNDACCDIGFFSCGQCDNQFIFCLRGSSTSNDGNPNNCPLGRYSTGEIGDDSFTFGSPIASGVPNPMTFTGSVWPVSILLWSHDQCSAACSASYQLWLDSRTNNTIGVFNRVSLLYYL